MADLQMRLRKLVITPQGGPPILLLEVEILDPRGAAEPITFQIPGICVAALVPRLQAVLAEHPALCGQAGRVVEQLDWSASVDAEKARYN